MFHRFKSWFLAAVAPDEAERPIENFLSPAEPLIGPRVNYRSRQAAADDAFDVPAEHFGLLLFGVADGIHAEFAENERLVVGEVLQAGEVAVKILLAVEVDIESDEVAVLREEVFGRGVARVGKKGLGIGLAADGDQLLDEFRDFASTEPADHVGRNFVAHEVSKNGRVAGIFRDPIADGGLGRLADFSVVEEFEVFRPGNGNQGADAEFLAEIEKPPGWDIVNPDEVHAGLSHQFKIGAGFLRIPKMLALGVGCERAVGHSLDEKLFISLEKKLRTNAHGTRLAHDWKVSTGSFKRRVRFFYRQ